MILIRATCRIAESSIRSNTSLFFTFLKHTMNSSIKVIGLALAASCSLISCGDLSNELDKKLNELENKTQSLDSIVNKEVDKVLTLDTLIEKERQKLNNLDTLVKTSTSKIDSIVSKGKRIVQ
jgi:hypothetical protein